MTDEGRAVTPPSLPGVLEELSRAECLELLGSASIGRLAVVLQDGLPLVVPVNYVLDGETVVFRTDIGSKLDALRLHPVGFQADSFDMDARTGWSVLMQGVAHEVTPQEVGQLDVEPWTGPKVHWIRVVPRILSGRRIRLAKIG